MAHTSPTTGQRIHHFRKGRGLTQAQLAAVVGVSPSAVSLWESDSAVPTLENLTAVCAAVDAGLSEFFAWSGDDDDPLPAQAAE